MLNSTILDSLIDTGPFFSINEKNMTITVGLENRLYVDNGEDFNGFNVFMKVTDFPLGDNLFNFLAIPSNDLETIYALASQNEYWDGTSPDGSVRNFFLSLDCIYLYLLFYSYNRYTLKQHSKTHIENIVKEFDFALNFCCNDSFDKYLKPLTALQRYYIYCQLYADNRFTIERGYEGEDFLFLEAEQRIDVLDKIERKKAIQPITDDVFESEPVTEAPSSEELKEIADSLKEITVSASYRYQHVRIEHYLLKELFALIKSNVKVKKCKRCGKYFILKGDYATDYCDRIPEGEKFTCKKLAAIRARKNKVQNNPILKEYEKAYKRMYARLSNRKILNEEFRLWVEEASQERDRISTLYTNAPSNDLIESFKRYLGNK
ncbi:DUF6076 domain-containing protein [Hungatella hathewayi]|jgi:hypothetical protein|uniref:DUF6076 domain-containing protein n=1 Tax=Hungatella hathewayi TaxID=154046 RepID=UPI00321ABF98